MDSLTEKGFSRLEAEEAVHRLQATLTLLAKAAMFEEAQWTPESRHYNAGQAAICGIMDLESRAREDLQMLYQMI